MLKHGVVLFPEAQLLATWVWLKIKQEGQTAGFRPCFHLPGFRSLGVKSPIQGLGLLGYVIPFILMGIDHWTICSRGLPVSCVS